MDYSEPQSYQWKEHIRKRPAMYIGNLRMNGFRQLLEYLFEELLELDRDHPVFEMTFYKGNRVRILIKGISTKEVVSRISEIDETPKPPFYLGMPVLIALSSEASIMVHHLPSVIVLSAKQGDYQWAASSSQEKENTITIDFTLDKEIFKELELVYEQVNPFLQQFAYLNPEVKIISEDHSGKDFQRNTFHYPKGIFHQLDLYLSQLNYWHEHFRLDIEASVNGYQYQVGLHNPDYWAEKTHHKTFAGNIETYWGGSLENGIVHGLSLAIKALCQKEQVNINLNKKAINTCFGFIAAVKGKDFVFEGSTKRKLGMPQIKKDAAMIVYEHVMEYYLAQPDKIAALLERFRSEE